MSRRAGAILVLAAALTLPSCRRGENGERGGDLERQLVEAAVAGDLAQVQKLLRAGADPNKMAPFEGHDQSPWRMALNKAKLKRPDTIAIVKAMIKSGANPEVAWGEAPSKRGGFSVQQQSPLLDAVSIGSAEIARALIEAGRHPSVGGVALELAVENGQVDIVHVLVEGGVDVNNTHGATTALVAAVNTRNVALLNYLEEHGAREKP
jgi:ankyrin repeat protein